MTTVLHLLRAKGRGTYTVFPTCTVLQAMNKMSVRNVGALVVVERPRPLSEPTCGTVVAVRRRRGAPVGIITERACVRGIVPDSRRLSATFVQEIMSTELSTVSESSTLEDCLMLMSRERVRYLAVLRSGQLTGLISMGDVVRFLAEQLRARAQRRAARPDAGLAGSLGRVHAKA